MHDFEHLKGSDEARRALEELVRVGRRSVATYRAAERRVQDHRMRAALAQLRRDHQRHVRELASVLSEIAGTVVVWDGASSSGPVVEAVRAGAETAPALLPALKRAEAELRELYATHVGRGYPEPLRSALSRHLREEEAHLEWLEQGRWWGRAAS